MNRRLFIAIPLSPEALSQVSRAAQYLRSFLEQQKYPSRVRWLPLNQLHITLKFLGNTDVQHIPKVEELFQIAAKTYSAFWISIWDWGLFSNTQQQTLWLGVNDPSRQFTAIAHHLEKVYQALGYPSENRPFTPHLTVARMRRGTELSPWLKSLSSPQEEIKVWVNKLVLYESLSFPSGVVHQILSEAGLHLE